MNAGKTGKPRRSLAEATRTLSQERKDLIHRFVLSATEEGDEYVDELAFISDLLVQLMDEHEQSPVGWAVVTAHKALIKMAANEGIIDAETRVKHPKIAPPVEYTMEHQRMRADALDEALVTLRRTSDKEVYDLRLENQDLRGDIQRLEQEASQLRVSLDSVVSRKR